MTDTIKLAVNQANLVANLRHAFTSKKTVLAELMQNARRARATQVAFAIRIDGIGDLKAELFRIAERLLLK